jgi:hypothetical protein
MSFFQLFSGNLTIPEGGFARSQQCVCAKAGFDRNGPKKCWLWEIYLRASARKAPAGGDRQLHDGKKFK